jgi:hypothetical protein
MPPVIVSWEISLDGGIESGYSLLRHDTVGEGGGGPKVHGSSDRQIAMVGEGRLDFGLENWRIHYCS